MQLTCHTCGKTFESKVKRKHCPECTNREINCVVCGKKFTTTKVDQKRCPDCYHKDIPAPSKAGEVKCAVCGTIFMAKNAQIAKYCPECQKLDHAKKKKAGATTTVSDNQKIVQVRCAHCGNIFDCTWKEYRRGRKYCNTTCRDEAQRKRTAEKYGPTPVEQKPEQVAELDYEPHPNQWPFHKSKARFRVLVCVPPGEVIPGDYKKIEDLEPGDKVFGLNRDRNKVYRTMSHNFNGELVEIKGKYILPFRVTPEHPILLTKFTRNDNYYALSRGNRKKKTEWRRGESLFVEAGELHLFLSQQDKMNRWCLQIPRILAKNNTKKWFLRPLKSKLEYNNEAFPINEDTAWLIGMYIAEGHTSGGSVSWSLNIKETEYIERIKIILEGLGYTVSMRIRSELNAVQIYTCSTQLAELFNYKFGHGAANKRIPDELMRCSKDKVVISLLRGYLDGDGYVNAKDGRISAKTASKILGLQLQLLFARLGFLGCLQEVHRKPTSIKKREIKSNNCYVITVSSAEFSKMLGYPHKAKQWREFGYIFEDAAFVELTKVSRIPYSGQVYNLSTTDETFIISNVVTHNCGTRFGKDRASINEGIRLHAEMLSENRPSSLVPRVMGWLVAPTYKLARQLWLELKYFMPSQWVVHKNESERQLETVYDGLIEVKSADDPDSLVAVGLDWCILTEAGRVKNMEEVFSYIRGRLASPGRGLKGQGGLLIANGTPKGRNYFYKMYMWGQDPTMPEWESWHYTSYDNPYIDRKEFDDLKKTMPERLFRQEILAEFLSDGGEVFANVDELSTGQIEDPVPGRIYKAAWDPAQRGDRSCFGIRDQFGRQVYLRSFTGIGWEQQLDIVEIQCKRYNHASLDIDMTGIGETLPEAARKRGLMANGIYFAGGGHVKERLVSNLCILMEQKVITLLNDETQKEELKSYEYSITKSGNIKYSAPASLHDDHVSMLLMLYSDFNQASIILPWRGFLGGIKKKAI